MRHIVFWLVLCFFLASVQPVRSQTNGRGPLDTIKVYALVTPTGDTIPYDYLPTVEVIGMVSGGGDYDNGTYATITAEPGWVNWFLGWSDAGIADTNADMTAVFMDRDRVATALFAAPDFQVTQVSAPSNAIAGQLVRIGRKFERWIDVGHWQLENPAVR